MESTKLYDLFENLGFQISLENISLKVPLIFKERFEWKKLFLFDLEKAFLLIKEKREGSLNSFIKQAKVLSERSNLESILVFTSLSNEVRRILLKSRTPFIDYRGNIFLPMLTLVAREGKEKIDLPTKFTKNEQALLIYILLLNIEFFTYKDLMQGNKFAQTTVFRALKKFVQFGWLTSVNDSYTLTKAKKETFQNAREYFFNPIQKKIYIDEVFFQDNLERPVIAGTKALSEYSFIHEDEMTYAVSKKFFDDLKQVEGFNFKTFNEKIPDTIELQIWKYDPALLNNEMVDPLSLYLTLQDDEDPRVEQALEKLLQNNLECGWTVPANYNRKFSQSYQNYSLKN